MEEKTNKNNEKFKDFLLDVKFNVFDPINNWYYSVKWYFKNRKLFNKIIRQWRPWDYSYQLELFMFGIEQLRNCVMNGQEEESSRLKKVAAMDELIKQLKRDTENEAYELVYGGLENSLITKDIGKYQKLIKVQKELRNQKINKIFSIIKGQDCDYLSECVDEEVNKIKNNPKLSDKKKKELTDPDARYNIWTKYFDGTGIEGWWN